jgi:hypothetical protein
MNVTRKNVAKIRNFPAVTRFLQCIIKQNMNLTKEMEFTS